MSARRRRVVYTNDARTELRDILLYTEQEWDRQQRAAYERLIRDTIRTITRTPSIGRARDELSKGLRSHPVGSHVLFYWEREGELIIAHILHSRRDTAKSEWQS